MNPKDQVGAKKAPLRYVPSALVIGVSEAMDIGQRKYGPFNWREQPVSAMTYVEAIQRHLAAWVDGQDVAEDTGVHHLKHIGASVGILLDALGIPGGLLDDRPTKGPAADLLRALDKSTPTLTPKNQAASIAAIVRAVQEGRMSMATAQEAVGITPTPESRALKAALTGTAEDSRTIQYGYAKHGNDRLSHYGNEVCYAPSSDRTSVCNPILDASGADHVERCGICRRSLEEQKERAAQAAKRGDFDE